MPSFLQTTFLAGLAALAVPVLIHLFFRLKTKRVELGTIRFLRVVLEENARRRKVMRWLLLTLRMACVALLVVLFARPYFSSAAISGDKELLVVLLDQSATMQLKGDQGRLFDQAVAEAKQLVQKAGENSRVEIALFDHAIHPLNQSISRLGNASADKSLVPLTNGKPPVAPRGASSNPQSPLQQLSEIKPASILSGATNYGIAFAWARDILINAQAGTKQLHLWTDLQQSGLDWTEVDPFPGDVEVHLHDLGRPIVNNVAVTEIRTPRTWVRPGDTATIQASVAHGGAFTLEEVSVLMELGRSPEDRQTSKLISDSSVPPAGAEVRPVDFNKLSARITQRERVKLVPGASMTLDFEIPALNEGLWAGRVTIEYDDDLAFDNRRYFAISSAPAYRVLVLKGTDADNPLLDEAYFLETALRLAGPGETYASNPFAPDIVAYADGVPLPDLAEYDSLVVVNVANLSRGDAERIATFVRAGGGMLVFSGDQISEQNCATLKAAGLTVGGIGQTEVTRDLPWRLQRWDEKHLVFQELSDPQHGDLRQWIFAAYTRIVPDPNAKVLAEFGTGHPAVLERELGQGKILWVSTSCGRDWGNWSRTRLFLPMVHQLIGYQVGLSAGGRVRTRLLDAERTEKAASRLETESIPEQAPLSPADPGVLRFQRYAEVVNVTPRESETDASSRNDFEDRFGFRFADTEGTTVAGPQLSKDVEFRPDEIWHWIACAVLCGILLEGFVGNRTTA